MAFTKQRFLINNKANADNITANSQGTGTIRQAKKDGTGTSLLTPSGNYSGASNLIYLVQCDLAGTVGSGATFRWRTSATAAGSWEATGVSATTTATLLSNGVYIQFDAGTLVLNDSFTFPAYAEYGPWTLFHNDRDNFWKSAAWTTLITNGGFDTATTGWSAGSGTIASVAGGVSGNCCQLTRVSDTTQYLLKSVTTVVGERYCYRGWVKSGTSGNETFRFSHTGGATVVTGTTSGTWTQYSGTFTANTTSEQIILVKASSTAGTMLFDEIEVFLVPSLEFDLSAAESITAFALLDHNLSSSATVTLMGNSSDAWVTPAYSLACTVASPIIEYISQSYQYWKVFINDPSNSDGFISIGKLYLGTYTEVSSGELIGGTNWDSGRTTQEIGSNNESDYGKESWQVYTEREEFPLVWTWLSLTALATIRTIWEAFRNLTTGQKIYYPVHYWYDDRTTLFWVTRVSPFSPTYHRGGHDLTLTFREGVITREI